MGLSAYKRTIVETESPRQIERRILARITSELACAQQEFDEGDSHKRLELLNASLRSTVSDNLKFWGALKLDLISSHNKMPDELKSSMISTALFVENQSWEILGGRGKVETLVEINTAIMNGLAGNAGNSATEGEVD
jgi:flagellar biosynthesis activator protein FlaF